MRTIVVGVDTHKYIHVAVALSRLGERLGDLTIPTDRAATSSCSRGRGSFGEPARFGVEGSGSYGQGLVRFLRRHDDRRARGRPAGSS